MLTVEPEPPCPAPHGQDKCHCQHRLSQEINSCGPQTPPGLPAASRANLPLSNHTTPTKSIKYPFPALPALAAQAGEELGQVHCPKCPPAGGVTLATVHRGQPFADPYKQGLMGGWDPAMCCSTAWLAHPSQTRAGGHLLTQAARFLDPASSALCLAHLLWQKPLVPTSWELISGREADLGAQNMATQHP